MRIGIVTFFGVNNFGAVLQAYALQETLKKKGHDVEIINYRCDFLERPYRLKNVSKKGIKNYIYGIFGYMTRLPRNSKFNKFRKDYLNISEEFDRGSLGKADGYYDCFISGSDQIWNLNSTGNDTTYYLDFASKSKKRSYAASFAVTQISAAQEKLIQGLLEEYEYISVREPEAKRIVSKLIKKDVEIVLDPTLLLKRHEWEIIMQKPADNRKYILVYQQNISKNIVVFAERLAKKYNYKLICIPFPIGKYVKAKCRTNYSPNEWLGLINSAELIVTDSYHGVALSVALCRQFYVGLPGHGAKTNSRIVHLLRMLGLSDRVIKDGTVHSEDIINYALVNERKDKLVERSMDFIEKMLSGVSGNSLSGRYYAGN